MHELWLFTVLTAAVVVLPGLDMAYVVGSALLGGRRGGLAATAGIICGGVGHVAMTTAGLGLLLAAAPRVFNALLLAGACYLAWIGIGLLRTAALGFAVEQTRQRSLRGTFVQGMTTSLLNPKAYLFMLAVFPRFIDTRADAAVARAALLGALIAAVQLAIYGMLALAAASTRALLSADPARSAALARAVGALLVGAAIWSVSTGWRAA